MALFPFFKKKEFFSASEKEEIVHAIKIAEKETSGEIRIFIESKNYLVNPLERAKEVFLELEMQQTEQRNAVLIYVAVHHHEVAVFADEGIYQKVDNVYWDKAVQQMISHFKHGKITHGLIHTVLMIGSTLKEKFPCKDDDQNELPDDIVFGK